ncbi:MAG: hypothetical protein IT385_30840 [Deltaproteobacteria bacterium]|nr:hypothetical protein [Deltaproteobacteria bacterium]
MQAVLGLAVSDASLLRTFAEAHPRQLDVLAAAGATQGSWGLGFHAHGEMLIKKGPLTRGTSLGRHLKDIRARHIVLVADGDSDNRHLEERCPLRYRDWLFAMTGGASLGPDFPRRVQAELPTYAFSGKRHPTAEEAVMMVIMEALERQNARDTRDLTTRAIQRAIGLAAERLRGLAERPEIVVMLHLPAFLFAFGIGRSVWIARFRGAGDGGRPGRVGRNDHLRAVLVGDHPGEAAAWEAVGQGLAIEVDAACDVQPFPA